MRLMPLYVGTRNTIISTSIPYFQSGIISPPFTMNTGSNIQVHDNFSLMIEDIKTESEDLITRHILGGTGYTYPPSSLLLIFNCPIKPLYFEASVTLYITPLIMRLKDRKLLETKLYVLHSKI